MSDVKVFVVSYIGVDSEKLIGVATSPDNAILLISTDFMKNHDHETFEVSFTEDVTVNTENGVLTTWYQITEKGTPEYDTGDCYVVQETWLS